MFSGLLLVFAFPDWNLWSLGWVGTAPLIMAVIRERRFWRSLLLGWITGLVFYVGSSSWVTYSMHHYGGIPLWLSYVFMLILGIAMGSFTGLFGGAFGIAIKRFGGWAILSAPLIWASSEYARLIVTNVGWNALGYSQAFQPAVIQVSRWGGVYLVSAIMVMASTSLVYALVYLEQRRGLIVLTVAGIIAVTSVVYGESLRPSTEGPHSLTALVIQPNLPVDGKWDDPRFVNAMLQQIISQSEQALHSPAGNVSSSASERGSIDLVVWPESPMNFEYDRDSDLQRELAGFTRRNQVYLLISSWGYPRDDSDSERIYNSAILISPPGEKVGEYDKVRLMPFGEYVPARGWIPFMNRIPALVADVTPGSSLELFDVAGARLGPSICFEATRPELVRQLRRQGATTIVQMSNETWFGPTACAHQMLAQSVLRAVENNVELVRATNSGRSAKIDNFGRISGETPMLDTAERMWELETSAEAAANRATFYTRHGDVFVIASAIATLLILAASLLKPAFSKNR